MKQIRDMELDQDSIQFHELFPKEPIEIIVKAVNNLVDSNELDGQFVGNKGWFLVKASEKLDKIWDKLTAGPINLDQISSDWGNIGEKRVFIALEEYAKSKKIQDPMFTRKELRLFLNSFILQEWHDAVNKFDINESEISFDKIITQIPSDYRETAIEIIKQSLNSHKSDLLLGDDSIVRRKSTINETVGSYINSKLLNVDDEITYKKVGSKFGLQEEDVSSLILQLIEDKIIEMVTNYPVDGLLRKR